MADKTVTIRIILFDLPAPNAPGWQGVYAGVRTSRDVEHRQPCQGEDLVFEVRLRVRPQAPGGIPNFLGPAVRGTPLERHIGIGWGHPNDAGGFRVVRGCKLFLTAVQRARWSKPGITWSQIDSGGVVQARLSAVGSDGGPVCAGQAVDWEVVDIP